jgi:hypothetical protein
MCTYIYKVGQFSLKDNMHGNCFEKYLVIVLHKTFRLRTSLYET